MKLEEKITEKLNERKWYHRITALTLVLSILCAFLVSLNLVRPGFAMENETDIEIEQMDDVVLLATTETEVIAADEFFKVSIGNDNATVTRDNGIVTGVTIDGKTADNLGVDGKINSVTITDGKNTYTDNPIDIDLGDASGSNFTLYLDYKYTKDQANALTADNGSPFIYLQIPDNIEIQADVYGSGKTAWVIDSAYSGSKPSGYFSIDKESKLLVIRFTEDYIDKKIRKSSGFSGTVFFSGNISRDDTVDGDQSFTIGSTDINIKFNDKSPSITKSSSIQRDENGNKFISWTISISNPEGLTDFNGYLLTDILTVDGKSKTLDLSKVENLKVEIDGIDQTESILANTGSSGNRIVNGNLLFDKVEVDENGNTIKNNPEQITITYRTDAETGVNENTASFGKDGSTPISNSAKENISNKITIFKSGSPDYNETGKYDNSIVWNITVKDAAGDSLSTTKVEDPMLIGISAGDVLVKNKVTGEILSEKEGYKLDATHGAIEFLEGSPSEAEIIYTKKFDPKTVEEKNITELANGIKKYRIGNKAKLFPGEGKTTDTPEYSSTVDYVTGYTAEKNGTYDADKGVINWSITVHSDYTSSEGYADGNNKTGVNGFKLTDAAFTNIQDSDIHVSSENVKFTKNGDTIELSYADGYSGDPIKNVTITYSTPYDYNMTQDQKNSFANGEAVTVGNDVTVKPNDKDGNKTTSETIVQSRRSVSKYLQESSSGSVNESTFTADDTNRTLTWVSELIDDSGFSKDRYYFDSLISLGGDHYITEPQAGYERVTVEVKDSTGKYTQAKNYEVKYYSKGDLNADGSLIDPNGSGKSHSEFFTEDNPKAYAFKINFTDGGDIINKKYLKITYQTTADISSVGLNEDRTTFDDAAQYKNVGHYGNSSDDDSYFFEREDKSTPDKTTLKIHKSWNDDNNLYGDRPEKITVKIERSTDRVTWEKVPGPDTYTVEASKEWNLEITGLDQWDPTKPLDETKNPVHYYYRAVEVNVPAGYYVTSTSDGAYADSTHITDNIVNSTTKAALKITKTWNDNNAVSERPESVTVNIYRRVAGSTEWGKVYKEIEILSANEGTWVKTEPLEKFAENDTTQVYEYKIEEQSVNGYRISYANNKDSIAADAEKFELGINNTLNKTDLTVDKQWDDIDDIFGKRPGEIHFIVMRKLGEGGQWERYGNEVYSIRPNARKRWTTTISNLPAADDNGTFYYYKVVEGTYDENNEFVPNKNIPGYKASYSDENGVAADQLNISETIKNTATDKYVKYPINQFGERVGAAKLSSIPTVTYNGKEYYMFRWEIRLVNMDPNSLITEGGATVQAIFIDKIPEGSIAVTKDTFAPEETFGEYYPKMRYYDGFEYALYPQANSNEGYRLENNDTLKFYIKSNVTSGNTIKYYTAIPVENFNEDKIINKIMLKGIDSGYTDVEREIIDDIVIVPDKHAMEKKEGVSVSAGTLVYNIDFNKESEILGDGSSIDITDLLTIKETTNPNIKFYLKKFSVKDAVTETEVANASYRVESNKEDRKSLQVEEFEDSKKPDEKKLWRINGLQAGERIRITLSGKAGENVTCGSTLWFYNKVVTFHNARYEINGVFTGDVTLPIAWDTKFDENGEYTFEVDVDSKFTNTTNGVFSANIAQDGSCPITGLKAEVVKDYAQKLYINVPDGRHLKIEYEVGVSGVDYKDTQTDTTFDNVVVRNEASFNTGSSKSSSVVDGTILNVDDSLATSRTNEYPEIYKADVGNQEINDLNATFLVSYWDGSQWIYASKLEEIASDQENAPDNKDLWNIKFDNPQLIDSTTNDKHYYPKNAPVLTISKNNAHKINLNPDNVYRFIEIEGPESGGYQKPVWEETINEKTVRIPIEDNSEFVYYFSYANTPQERVPKDVASDKIKIIAEKSKINILNSKKVNIIADKTFVGSTPLKTSTVTYELYWSYDKSSKLPDNAQKITASVFGTASTKTLYYDVTDKINKNTKAIWENLPTGIEGKAVYYYVVEQSYTIDGKTYNVANSEGLYSPVYTGNGTDGIDSTDYAKNGTVNATVHVANTEGVVAKKLWRNSDGSEMDMSLIPKETTIKFRLWGNVNPGVDFDPKDPGKNGWKSITIPEGKVLSAANDWSYVVPEEDRYTIENGEKVPYRAYKIEEDITADELTALKMTWKGGQLNSRNGVVYLVNTKDRTPTSAVVTKTWDDNDITDHSQDKVKVQLYVTRRNDLSEVELAGLNNGTIPNGMVAVSNITNLPTPAGKTGEMSENVKTFKLDETNGLKTDTVELTEANDWTASWKNLPGEIDPLKPGENRLYYYVVELSATDKNNNSLLPTETEHGQYTSELEYSDHTSAQYSLITNKSVERGNLNVAKHMVDDDSDSDNRPAEINFNIYRVLVENTNSSVQTQSVLPVSRKTTAGLSVSSVRRMLVARNAVSVPAVSVPVVSTLAETGPVEKKDANGNTYYEENGKTYYQFSPLGWGTFQIPTPSAGSSFTEIEVVDGVEGENILCWGVSRYDYGNGNYGGANPDSAAKKFNGKTGTYDISKVSLTPEQNYIYYNSWVNGGSLKLYFVSKFTVSSPTETEHNIPIGREFTIEANKAPSYTITPVNSDVITVNPDATNPNNLVVTANHAGTVKLMVESSPGAGGGKEFTITVHALELQGQQPDGKVSIGALEGAAESQTIKANYIAEGKTLSVKKVSGESADMTISGDSLNIEFTGKAGITTFTVTDGTTTREVTVNVGPKLQASIEESSVKSGETFTIKTNKLIEKSAIGNSLPDNMYVSGDPETVADGYKYTIMVNSDVYRKPKYKESITLSSGVAGDTDVTLSINVEMVYEPVKVPAEITTRENLIGTVTLHYDAASKQYVLDSENAAKLQNLPVGTADGGTYMYYVSEVTGTNGYVQGKTPNDNYYPCQYDGNTGVNLADDSNHTIVVHNKRTSEEVSEPVTLPEAGGSGTEPYTVVGMAIMISAGTIIFFKRRYHIKKRKSE